MSGPTINTMHVCSFYVSFLAILAGAVIGIMGIWGAIPYEGGFFWKLLATDGVVFAAAVLTNLAISCFRNT